MVKSDLTREVETWDDVIRWIVTLGAAYLPFLMSPITADAFEIPKATALYVLSIALLAAFSIRSLYLKKLVVGKSPLDLPVLLFLGVVFTSTLTSPTPILSVIGRYAYYEGILTVFAFTIFYFMASRFITKSDHVRRLITHVITAFTLVSIYGLLQHFGIDARQPFLRTAGPIGSTLGNPILLGGYSALVLPLIFNAIIDAAGKGAATGIAADAGEVDPDAVGSGRKNTSMSTDTVEVSRPVLLGAFALGVANVFLTQSRSALLGLAVGLLFVSIARRKNIAAAKNAVLAAAALAIAVTAIVFILPTPAQSGNQASTINTSNSNSGQAQNQSRDQRQQQYQGQIQGQDKTNDMPTTRNPLSYLLETSIEVRKELWKSAISMISVRPVSGYGPDQAYNWWLRFQTFEHAKLEIDTPINRARNEFLQTAIDNGVPGLLVFLWILTTAILIFIKNIKTANNTHPENTPDGSLYVMITAGLIAYFTQAFFGIASIGVYPLVWALLGTASPAKEKTYLEFAMDKQPRQLFAIATLSVAIFTSVYVFKPFIADFYSFKGKAYRHSGDISNAVKDFVLAVHYNPSQAVYRKDLALIYYEQAKKTNNARLAQQGISIAEQALSTNPDDSSVMANIATGYRISALLAKENSLFNTAELYYGRTIEACPNFVSPRRAMLGMLLTKENYDDAIEQALYILQIDPDDTDVKYRLGLAYEKTGKIGRARRIYNEILVKYPDTADVKMALMRIGR